LNNCSKAYPVNTRVELALKLEPLLREKAKANLHHSPGRGKKGLQNSAKVYEAIDTRYELAKVAGVSHDTFAKAKIVAQHADEETKKKLRENQVSVHGSFIWKDRLFAGKSRMRFD